MPAGNRQVLRPEVYFESSEDEESSDDEEVAIEQGGMITGTDIDIVH